MTKTIIPGIRYIGVDDLALDLFEGQYAVPEGMAYNSYIIEDEKTAVLDTADASAGEAWKENLLEALAGKAPDYLVAHHVEPDHAGLIVWALGQWPSLTLVTSAKAVQLLGQFHGDVDFSSRAKIVKEGDELALGARTLRFFAAPMVHWPEVLVSFETAGKVLFSADAFGKFGALSKCGYFGEEDGDWACEARRYYFNICGKYGMPVQTLLRKVAPLSPAVICPLHGPILRKDLSQYLDLYQTWSSYGVETEGVFVAYASMHGGTAAAALKLAEILREKGCPKVATADLCRDDMAEAVEDAFRYGKMVLAAPTYDGGLFTPAANFIHLLAAKAWQQRRVGLIENGSWAPAAARIMKESFAAMKGVTVIEPAVTLLSTLKPADLPALEALADALLA
ncbi:MAG: FprA family A-type flavoprotein [Bacteroidales bacterium]|nr:FprA family A-type flavoprotein [Bacteroidales bacterium]